MTYLVKAIFEDGTSKIVKYTHDYNVAIGYLMSLVDQRRVYASLVPLLTNVHLVSGGHMDFSMRVERGDIKALRLKAAAKNVAIDTSLFASTDNGVVPDRLKSCDVPPANLIHMSSYRRSLNELDMLTRWEPSRTREAGFHSGIDNSVNTIRATGSGIWREQHASLYFEQQRKIVDRARQRFGPLKVLFDVRNWVVENPQSALQFQGVNQELYRPDDRLVAVVRAVADKEHPRTALRGENTEVFTSMSDAETWLQRGAISA